MKKNQRQQPAWLPYPYGYPMPTQSKPTKKQKQVHQIDWPSFLVGILAGAGGLFVYVVMTGGAQ